MFFIIPIGSEEGVRRLPYITMGLVVLNTLIWIITSSVLGSQEKELAELDRRMSEIEQRYIYKIIEKDPRILTNFDLETIHDRFATDSIIPVESEDYYYWQSLYREFKEKKSRVVFEQWGFKPSTFNLRQMFSSLFIHANFLHLLFNMLFLWLVGCNIEDDWSWKIFPGLYLISGVVACLFHTAAFPKSDVPLIGASGAIAGIMGAFMIRHFKTKIRFAYFIWIILRPYFGTFTMYAGIALPIWFLEQILGASWSIESGTAYWAHIGGFVFGAVVGASFKFFGVEKKYIEPMVEETFEKLKLSPKMKEINRKLDAGDTAGAIPLLLQIINEEPGNFDACLILARMYFEKGHHNDAAVMYNKVLDLSLRTEETELKLSIYEEIKEKNLLNGIYEKNIYNLANFLEKLNKYEEAIKIYDLYINLFPNGRVRSKALYRDYLIYKNKVKDQLKAQNTLWVLKKEYPEFPVS